MAFNDKQQQAIDVEVNKDILISAAAGSGKTTVLTEHVKNILLNSAGVDTSQILALTFTNNAAHEMKNRILEAFKDQKESIKEKVLSMHIQTFDSFAQEIVKDNAAELNIPATFIIANDFVLEAKKIECLDEILLEKYKNPSQVKTITELLQKYNIRDDSATKRVIIFLSNELDKMIPKKQNEFVDSFRTGERFSKKWYLDKIKNLDLPEANSEFYQNDFEMYKSSQSDVLYLLDIALEVNKRVKKYKFDSNCFSYQDIAEFALALLTEDKYSHIARKIRNQFKYILIDEYQDTNDLQEQVLASLLKTKEDGSRSHIFCVGDKKQSIYAFRNSNVELFNQREKEYSPNNVIYMNTNYRSCNEVINDINYIFKHYLTLEYGGVDYASEDKKDQLIFGGYDTPTNLQYPGVVRIVPEIPFDKKVHAETMRRWEAKAIVQDIKNKHELGYKYSDFTILARTKKEFEMYQRVFASAGIPLNQRLQSDLNEIDVVMLIQSVITLIVLFENPQMDPKDEKKKHMFVSICRSFISPFDYSIRDQKIYDLISTKQYINDPFFIRIKNFAKETSNLPFATRFIKLIDEFEIIAKLYLVGEVRKNIAKIESLYQIILSFEDSGEPIKTFVDVLNIISKYNINVEDNTIVDLEDAVSMMTIHQAKGLESKIVYLPNASNHIADIPAFLKPDYIFHKDYGIVLPFYNVNDPNIKTDSIQIAPKICLLGLCAQKVQKQADISEHRRLYYVALTRAKEQICIVGQPYSSSEDKKETMYGMLSKLESHDDENSPIKISYKTKEFADNWYVIKIDEQQKAEVEPKLDEKIEVNDEIINFPVLQHKRASATYTSEDENQFLLEKGSLYHLLMELVDLDTKDTSFIKDKQAREVIDKVLKLQIFKDISGGQYFKEYGYYDEMLLTTGFIDLLVIKDGYYYILDYKLSNIDKPEYQNQLLTYRRNIKDIFNVDESKIKMLLIALETGKYKEIINK